MQKTKINKRKIHRKVAALSAIPLLITIITGTAFSILQPFGIDAFWLIKWHTGNFGIFNFQPFYSIFLGISSIISVISGIKLLQKNA
tara:strand:+ start:812 stop:1072 length:261 start_codon:yes stop_codon:yes gene_type:complete